MLEDFFSPPTLRLLNGVDIWNLLWLSSRPIIETEPKEIYKRTFPDT